MSVQREAYIFYREFEDKTEQELGVFTVTAAKVKAVFVSQFIDLRDAKGDTFATITFPSWVKVRKMER